MMTAARLILYLAAALPLLALTFLTVSAAPLFDAEIGTSAWTALANVLSNTFWIVLCATALAWLVALPSVIASLNTPEEARSGTLFRKIVDFGSSYPRLLWGVAGAGLFGGVFGLGVSALTGVLTLGCLLAPIVATTLLDGFSIKARQLLHECRALGMTRFQTVVHCVIPAASHSIRTALCFSLARGLGDAAAVILTAGSAFSLVTSLSDPGATLSVYLLVLVLETPGQQLTAYAAAALLFVLSALLQLLPAFLFSNNQSLVKRRVR